MAKEKIEEVVTNSEAPDDVAYILEFPNAPHTNGLNRLVNWVGGCGVLDRRAVADTRPDLVDARTFKMKAGYDVLGSTAAYWAERGCNVKKTTAAKADAYREKLDEKRRAMLAGPPAETVVEADGGDEELVKVNALAKEVGLMNKEAVEMLREAGIDFKNASSNVPAEAARAALTRTADAGGAAPHEQ